MIKVVAVGEVGGNFLSRSPISAAGCFEFCPGRPSRWQKSVAVARLRRPAIFKSVAVAEFGEKILLRSATSAAAYFVPVAEVGDKIFSRSPTLAAGYFQIHRGRRSGRQNFVAVVNFGLDRGGPGYGWGYLARCKKWKKKSLFSDSVSFFKTNHKRLYLHEGDGCL